MPQVAYRAVRSRRKFNKSAKIKKCLGARMDAKVKPHFVNKFEGYVSDWSVKPEFKARKFIAPDSIRIHVFPAGAGKDRWIWVSRGTRPHKIPTAGPALLSFMLGYSARTKPRGRAHVGTGKASGPRVTGIMQVDHPGTEAREFEEVTAETEKPRYSRTMEGIWRQCIRSA